MFRKTVLTFLIIISLFLGGCSASTPTPTEIPTAIPTPTPEPTAIPVFPITLTDGLGREITLDSAPERIISLSPSNTEILFAVGAGKLVVGNTKYCDYPMEAQNLPKIGGFSGKSISVETIISLKPDLVLANDSGQESVIEALEQANVKVIAVKAASFDDVYANLETVGKITGHDTEAAAVVTGMKARVETVTNLVAGISEENRPTIFWEVWDEPMMTAGPETYIGQLISMAGGINIFADLQEDYPQVSPEEIIKRNPNFILGPDTHGDKLTAQNLASRPGWDQIEAVKNDHIFLIDGNTASRSGPRLVDALEAMVEALYPELSR